MINEVIYVTITMLILRVPIPVSNMSGISPVVTPGITADVEYIEQSVRLSGSTALSEVNVPLRFPISLLHYTAEVILICL
jgi:hypothetical protein